MGCYPDGICWDTICCIPDHDTWEHFCKKVTKDKKLKSHKCICVCGPLGIKKLLQQETQYIQATLLTIFKTKLHNGKASASVFSSVKDLCVT